MGTNPYYVPGFSPEAGQGPSDAPGVCPDVLITGLLFLASSAIICRQLAPLHHSTDGSDRMNQPSW